jgi:hypothetical protein
MKSSIFQNINNNAQFRNKQVQKNCSCPKSQQVQSGECSNIAMHGAVVLGINAGAGTSGYKRDIPRAPSFLGSEFPRKRVPSKASSLRSEFPRKRVPSEVSSLGSEFPRKRVSSEASSLGSKFPRKQVS